ncbi:phage/plasmid primase, P4 family [Amycolatopsis sp. WAC 01376]|uniref:DNA primase family protein n=1 Tax=Amycolatopsis sp. WAC 01376 TaxID=2203195 RepID=UPI000F78571E|nr:phage/plasmid primase, P4 family [Amycolatopsis sp. WAC 01376]
MTTIDQWRAAANAVTVPGYGTLARPGALDDLADRLHLLAAQEDQLDGFRRMLAHLAYHEIPNDDWARFAPLHPATAGRNPATVLTMIAGRMEDRALTELGLARRIADQHGADLAWSRSLGGWATWDGKRWRTDNGDHLAQGLAVRTVDALAREVVRAEAAAKVAAEDAAQADEVTKEAAAAKVKSGEAHAKAVRNFARDAQKARTIANALTLARSEGLAVDAEQFDARPELLTVANGTVELGETATVREHRRADRLTRVAKAAYDPDATSAEWDAFVAHVIPDAKARAYAQKLMGYSLFGENNKRKLIFLMGPTSSGKSTLLKVIGKVLGDYAGPFAISLFAGKQTDAARPDILKALPRRIIHADDPPERWVMYADEIKALAGNVKQEARRMRSDEFTERIPAFTGWIACNKPPTIVGADQALWTRLIAIPCGDTIEKEDTSKEARLGGEHGSAVLAWLIEGWNLYQAEGIDDIPHAVVDATMRLRDNLSPIDVWLSEATEKDAEYITPMGDLWDAFNDWCDYARIKDDKRLTLTAFGRGLTDRGFTTRQVGPKRVKARTGLRLVATEHAGGTVL